MRFVVHFGHPERQVIDARGHRWETVCGRLVGLGELAITMAEVTCLECLSDLGEPEQRLHALVRRPYIPRQSFWGRRRG